MKSDYNNFHHQMNLLFSVLFAFLRISYTLGDPDMTYVPLPATTSPGGKCMDGSMAGYYLREGSADSSLFVIQLKGGGGCSTEEECDGRPLALRSSSGWSPYYTGDKFLSKNCAENPTFCEATAVYIPYCTSDAHRGTNTNLLWGKYYFDGHTNFKAIIEKLVVENNLDEADNVLLTGSSAGSIGALFNVDWLASRLPEAKVKVVPVAGWYSPGALADDLPSLFLPSDYPHFAAGENGNAFYNKVQMNSTVEDLYKSKGILPAACLEAYADDEWWACMSANNVYKYIKSPLFNVHTQYDKNQIFSGALAPESPSNETELDMVESYIEMWGKASRESFQKIANNETDTVKPHQDGIFAASCVSHGTHPNVEIDGMKWMEIVHDWFFQLGQYESSYRLIETCTSTGDRELPCNPHKSCVFPFEKPPNQAKQCVRELFIVDCLESFGDKNECFQCALENKEDLAGAGCTKNIVERVCKYVEENDIDGYQQNSWEGENLAFEEGDLITGAGTDDPFKLKNESSSAVGINLNMWLTNTFAILFAAMMFV